MRHFLVALALCTLALFAGCDLGEGPPKGTFNLMNDGDATLSLLVSDNDQCVIGLHSSVATHTWRNYDFDDKAGGAWLCIDKKPFKVVDGKSYQWTGGQVVETAGPEGN